MPLFLCQWRSNILIVSKEDSDFYKVLRKKVENEIHQFDILVIPIFINLLPFDFFCYPQFWNKTVRHSDNLLVVFWFYKNTTIKVGVIFPFFVAFVKPNVIHTSKFCRKDTYYFRIHQTFPPFSANNHSSISCFSCLCCRLFQFSLISSHIIYFYRSSSASQSRSIRINSRSSTKIFLW